MKITRLKQLMQYLYLTKEEHPTQFTFTFTFTFASKFNRCSVTGFPSRDYSIKKPLKYFETLFVNVSDPARNRLHALSLHALRRIQGSGLDSFKKVMFNSVSVTDGRMSPAFNRLKLGHSHYLISGNELKNVSKGLGYVKENTIKLWIAESLFKCFKAKQKRNPVLVFTNIVDTQINVLLFRHSISKTLYQSNKVE
jgi:hypothetical protein